MIITTYIAAEDIEAGQLVIIGPDGGVRPVGTKAQGGPKSGDGEVFGVGEGVVTRRHDSVPQNRPE